MNADSTRTELLELLTELSAEYPMMRLGQLLCNHPPASQKIRPRQQKYVVLEERELAVRPEKLAMGAGRLEASAASDVEDVELIDTAKRWLEPRQPVASN